MDGGHDGLIMSVLFADMQNIKDPMISTSSKWRPATYLKLLANEEIFAGCQCFNHEGRHIEISRFWPGKATVFKIARSVFCFFNIHLMTLNCIQKLCISVSIEM